MPRKLVSTIFTLAKEGKWLISRVITYQSSTAKKESPRPTYTQGKSEINSRTGKILSCKKSYLITLLRVIQASVSSSSKLILSKTSEILVMSIFKSFNLLLNTSKCMFNDDTEVDLVKEPSVKDLVMVLYEGIVLAVSATPCKLLTLMV